MKHVRTSPSLLRLNTKRKDYQTCTLHTNKLNAKPLTIPTTEYIYSVAVVTAEGACPLVVMSADDLFRLMPKLSSDTANDNGGNER